MTRLLIFFLLPISVPLFSQTDVVLKYNLQDNDTYSVTTNIVSQSIQNFADNPEDVSTNQHINYTLKCSKNPSDKNFNLLVSFNKITSLVNQAGEKQFYSSDSTKNQVSEIFKSFLSKNLNFRMTPRGKKIPLYAVDELFPDSAERTQRYIFSQSVEQKVINDLPVSIIFPDSSVREGDSWTVTDTISSGIFNFCNETYTLDSVSEKEYFISEKSNFSTDKNNLIPINRVFISYNIKGLAENTYVLDKASCIIKKGLIKQTGTGSVYMKYTQNSDPAYTWDMTVNNTVTLKTTKNKGHE